MDNIDDSKESKHNSEANRRFWEVNSADTMAVPMHMGSGDVDVGGLTPESLRQRRQTHHTNTPNSNAGSTAQSGANNYNIFVMGAQPSQSPATTAAAASDHQQWSQPAQRQVPATARRPITMRLNNPLPWSTVTDYRAGWWMKKSKATTVIAAIGLCCLAMLLACWWWLGSSQDREASTSHPFFLQDLQSAFSQDGPSTRSASVPLSKFEVSPLISQFIDETRTACACAGPFTLNVDIVGPACGRSSDDDNLDQYPGTEVLDAAFHFNVVNNKLQHLSRKLAEGDPADPMLERAQKQLVDAKQTARAEMEMFAHKQASTGRASWMWDYWIVRGHIWQDGFWKLVWPTAPREQDEQDRASALREEITAAIKPLLTKVAADVGHALPRRHKYLKSLSKSLQELMYALDDSRSVVCSVDKALGAKLVAVGGAARKLTAAALDDLKNGRALFSHPCSRGWHIITSMEHGGGKEGERPQLSGGGERNARLVRVIDQPELATAISKTLYVSRRLSEWTDTMEASGGGGLLLDELLVIVGQAMA